MSTTALEFIIKANDQASEVFGQVSGSADGMGSKLGKVSAGAKVALAVAGVAAVKFAGDSIAAYTDAEEQQAKLAAAFAKYPALADSSQASLQKINSALQDKTRFEDDSIASAQATLATMGLTGKQLEEVTPLLLDYATATGTDVNTAAEQLGKSFNGQTRALKEVGINYKSTGDKGQDFANITDALKDKVGGFAETAGGTAAGKAERLKNKFGDLQETVGSKLVPILSKVTDIGLKMVDWIQKNQGAAIAIISVLGLFVGALAAVSVSQKIFAAGQAVMKAVTLTSTAVQWAWNAALTANPIGLIVAAIALLVAGLVLFFTKTKIGKKIWSALVDGFQAGWKWIKGAFTTGVGFVKDKLQIAWDFIKKVWKFSPLGLITENWDKIMNFFGGIPGKIKTIFNRVTDGIKNAFKAAFNWVGDLWNKSLGKVHFDIPSWVPKIGGKGWGFPQMPHLATGGRAIAPGLALVGERGAEVVKLGRGDTVYPHGTMPGMGGRMHPQDILALANAIGERIAAGIHNGAQRALDSDARARANAQRGRFAS